MENRVYYGEYSLKHWIDLILRQNIILPEYQRYFVWNENKVQTLIKTFEKRHFVPPITIGAFKNGNSSENLILDGQQRLTSILLAYLNIYPDKKSFEKNIEKFGSENDEELDEDEQMDNILEWTFKEIIKKGKTKKDILLSIDKKSYKELGLNLTDEFLNKTFLGFSYLVPYIEDDKEQQKFYSSVFRNINIQGEILLPQESRQSLYYLNNEMVQFFDPSFLRAYKIKNSSNESKLDFVRYLSLLSQFFKDNNTNKIARGYKPRMEKYYEEYIYSIVGENDSQLFADFQKIFPNIEYLPRFDELKQTIQELKINKQFPSIIDWDIYMFGLIHEIIFRNKKIDNTKNANLSADISKAILVIKRDSSHTRAPANLKHLKTRINKSIEIYRKYVKKES